MRTKWIVFWIIVFGISTSTPNYNDYGILIGYRRTYSDLSRDTLSMPFDNVKDAKKFVRKSKKFQQRWPNRYGVVDTIWIEKKEDGK
jgi:hypothetical protein